MYKLSSPTWLLASAAAGCLMLAAGGAQAQDRVGAPSTIDLLDVMVEKGLLNRAEADAVLAEARRRTDATTDVVRVPYVPESLRQEIRAEVREDVMATARRENWAQPDALPDWIDGIKISGDVRARADFRTYGEGNSSFLPDATAIREQGGVSELAIPPLLGTTDDRFRGRVRARLAVDAKVNDFVEAGLRFATGDVSDPVSTNEVLSPNFERLNIGLDRAFIRVKPFGSNQRFEETALVFGKFDNPFFSTEMVWDRDVQFDGLALTFDVPIMGQGWAPRLFGTVGAFPLDEIASDVSDKVLYAGQLGVSARPSSRFSFRAAAAYYQFDNVQSQFNTTGLRDNDETTPRRVQYGNSLFNIRRDGTTPNTVLFGLASEFEVGVVTAQATVKLTDTINLTLDGEYARNFAYDEDQLTNVFGVPASSGDDAWHVRGILGRPVVEKYADWQVSAGWRHVGADSLVDLFTDSDFGLGGTDQEGFVLKGVFGISDRFSLETTVLSARTIDVVDPLTGARADSIDTDTVLLDLLAKF